MMVGHHDMPFTIPESLVLSISQGDESLARTRRDCDLLFRTLQPTEHRRALKSVIARAKGYKADGQFSRLCAIALIASVGFGERFIREIDHEGLLLGADPDGRLEKAILRFRLRLERSPDPVLVPLLERVRTYASLCRLRRTAMASVEPARELVAERPFVYGPALLAVANLAFMRGYFEFEAGPFESLVRDFETPEEVSEAVSAALAMANEQQPLESLDFALGLTALHSSGEVRTLLQYGRIVSKIAEIEKLVSILGCDLDAVDGAKGTTFLLRPASPELEYAVRLGFVRSEIGTASSRLEVPPTAFSLRTAVGEIVEKLGDKLFEIKDPQTPRRRLRTILPMLPDLLNSIASMGFYEDLVLRERLAQELELPLKSRGQHDGLQLVPGLDVETFERAWRVLRFFCAIDMTLVKKHQGDPVLVKNSLMRVIPRQSMLELLGAFGLTQVQSQAFLGLVTADVDRLGHFDMQYRPFLAIRQSRIELPTGPYESPPEILHAPAVVAFANILPNVQRAHGVRLATNAAAFVEIAASHLQRIVPKVVMNREVKSGNKRTDVDIVALSDDTLYLFECKHSISPTEPHECRDPWRDVHKGVVQLELALDILQTRLADYLAGWFPGTGREVAARLTIKPCVLCSHRIFSGMTIRGIPIRDHASLAHVCGDATVRMGHSEDGRRVALMRYRMRTTEGPSLPDLDKYLGPDGPFFAMFRPFMRPMSRLEVLATGLRVAFETYVYRIASDEWQAELERLGAVRLDDEYLEIGPAHS